MTRQLDTVTLDGAGQYYAGLFVSDRPGKFGRDWVMGQFHDFHFKDEHEYLIDATREQLGKKARDEFDARISKLMKEKPREQKVFEKLLADRLAITPDGEHIEGRIGTVQTDARFMGKHIIEVESPESIRYRKANGIPKGKYRKTTMREVPFYWPMYAGEGDERIRPGGGAADPLPEGTPGLSVGALVFNMSAATAVLAVDALLDGLDEGTSNAVIECRSGAQPADPDAATTGTLAASLAMTDPAFAGAADQADGTVQAAASTISDDTSVDATVTVGYCRVSTTNDGLTPVTSHLDGSAGVGTFNFNWNTVAFVSGATASISAYTFDQSQGSTAT